MLRCMHALHDHARLSCYRYVMGASRMPSADRVRALLVERLDARVVGGWVVLWRDSVRS